MKKKLLKTKYSNIILNYLEGDKYVGELIASTGQYEPYESELLLKNIKAGDIVIDVGANIGYYTLLFAKKVGENGKVYSFEPDPISFAILEKNIQDNKFSNVEAFNIALSYKQEHLSLFISTENLGDHRLYDDHKIKRKKTKVVATTLDLFFTGKEFKKNKISLIKIDTQGYEPFITKGAKELIKNQKPTLFFEYWVYGYRQSRGNYKNMIAFLEEQYEILTFIDEENETTFPVNKDFINSYCRQLNGYLHCNLICKKPTHRWSFL